MAEGIPYEVRRSHEITGPGLNLGPRCVPLKTKRGQIDPFGASSVNIAPIQTNSGGKGSHPTYSLKNEQGRVDTIAV